MTTGRIEEKPAALHQIQPHVVRFSIPLFYGSSLKEILETNKSKSGKIDNKRASNISQFKPKEERLSTVVLAMPLSMARTLFLDKRVSIGMAHYVLYPM